uniref:TGF-beta family profile domain-containing protein n=1 Tax=Oncorhynchus mykiss TaxID=8022 RepID=A0A8C7TYG3_ONCMY
IRFTPSDSSIILVTALSSFIQLHQAGHYPSSVCACPGQTIMYRQHLGIDFFEHIEKTNYCACAEI